MLRGRRKLATALLAVVVAAAGCALDTAETGQDETTALPTGSTDVASTAEPSSTTPDSTEGVRLVADGLGVVRFGEPADSAIPGLVEALGREPSGDETMEAVRGGFGGTAVRFVEFGPLVAIVNDGSYYRNDGVMHLAGWTLAATGPSDLATPEGITIGSTVEDLRRAFGEDLLLSPAPSECTGTWVFSVGPSPLGFEGELSGPPHDAETSVARLSAGAQSEC